MKTLIAILIILLPLLASSYNCPSYIETNEDAQIVHSWLKRFAHRKELHGCELEIVACEMGEEADDEAPVGEVLVIDPKGRQVYAESARLIPGDYTWKLPLAHLASGIYFYRWEIGTKSFSQKVMIK